MDERVILHVPWEDNPVVPLLGIDRHTVPVEVTARESCERATSAHAHHVHVVPDEHDEDGGGDDDGDGDGDGICIF